MIFPPLPDNHGVAVMFLVVGALILFTREEISLETSSLGVLATLLMGFELFPYTFAEESLHAIDFFSGFALGWIFTVEHRIFCSSNGAVWKP